MIRLNSGIYNSNNFGQIYLKSAASYYGIIHPPYNLTSNLYYTLPESSGTLQIASSDIRLKDNIKDTEVIGLDFINKIKLRQFDWKNKKYHQPIGFVVDELEELDNNLSVGGVLDTLDDNGLPIDPKCVNTFYLQGYEVKAIQELSQRLDKLEKENAELRK